MPVVDPVHPKNVVLAGVAGHGNPFRRSARYRHDSNSDRRIPGSSFGIRKSGEFWIERVGVVDHREPLHPGLVELPERYVAAVWRPTERLSQVQLLLIDPIPGFIDPRLRSISSQGTDSAGVQVFDI